ncbi:MAG TPA: DUF3185 family protein [Cyclobacteriaceae bacterium]|jgi:uncharacterized membrane protein HdeD (DUF308 family)
MKLPKLLVGIVLLVIGIFVIYWAYNHSPEAGLGDRIVDALEGEKVLSKTTYYTMLVSGTLLIILGITRTVKSL